MATNRREILELLGQGKITAEEAADLLAGNDTAVPVADAPPKAEAAPVAEPMPEKAPPPVAPLKEKAMPETAVAAGHAPSWFRVRVRNLDTGKNRVSVNIPVRMLKFGMKIGKRFTTEMDDLNWDDINGMIDQMQTGMIVEVEDEESNEHVQVYLE